MPQADEGAFVIPVDLTYRIPIATATIVPTRGIELTAGSFGTGVGGEIDGHLTRFAEVRVAGFIIDTPTAGITRSREGALGLNLFDGTIGSSVFQEKRLILDYARRQVIVA